MKLKAAVAFLVVVAMLLAGTAFAKANKLGPEARQVLLIAKALQFVKYQRGGDLRWSSRTDCSGFVQHVFRQVGIELPRNSRAQSRVGKTVTKYMIYRLLKPGDLLFFRTRRYRIGHVGIYIGDGKMIHCTTTRRKSGVQITELRGSRFPHLLVVVKRVIKEKEA